MVSFGMDRRSERKVTLWVADNHDKSMALLRFDLQRVLRYTLSKRVLGEAHPARPAPAPIRRMVSECRRRR